MLLDYTVRIDILSTHNQCLRFSEFLADIVSFVNYLLTYLLLETCKHNFLFSLLLLIHITTD